MTDALVGEASATTGRSTVDGAAGATAGGYVLLRLPHELRALFTEWLQAHYPERAAHVLSLIRQTRGGALNDAKFGSRFSGVGVYADMLAKRFAIAARRFGLDEPMAGLDCSRFAPPRQQKDERQLALL